MECKTEHSNFEYLATASRGKSKNLHKTRGVRSGHDLEIIIDLPFGFPINNIISLMTQNESTSKKSIFG